MQQDPQDYPGCLPGGGAVILAPAPLHPSALLSRREVEAVFRIPVRFLEVAAVKGGGPMMTKLGRAVRYSVGDVEAWIGANKVASTSQQPAAQPGASRPVIQ